MCYSAMTSIFTKLINTYVFKIEIEKARRNHIMVVIAILNHLMHWELGLELQSYHNGSNVTNVFEI